MYICMYDGMFFYSRKKVAAHVHTIEHIAEFYFENKEHHLVATICIDNQNSVPV